MERNNNFTAIRLIAAFMVLSGHMSYLTGGRPLLFLGAGVQYIGVTIFFSVGGYLITKSYLSDPDPLRYAIKRFFRIIPPLAFFVLFALFVGGPLLTTLSMKEYFRSPDTWNYLKNLILFPIYMLPGVFFSNPFPIAVNGSLWTLPVEVFMYTALPLLLNLTGIRQKRKYAKHIWVLLTVGSFLFTTWYARHYPGARIVFYGTNIPDALNIIPYYLAGSMYATCIPKEKLNAPVAILLLFFAISLISGYYTSSVIFFLLLPYLVFSLAFSTPLPFASWLNKHELSYGIYLYGFFVQQTLVYLISIVWKINTGPNVYLLLSTVVTVVAAFFSSILIEEPCNQLSKKILGILNKE